MFPEKRCSLKDFIFLRLYMILTYFNTFYCGICTNNHYLARQATEGGGKELRAADR
jgi:hypothetical protein